MNAGAIAAGHVIGSLVGHQRHAGGAKHFDALVVAIHGLRLLSITPGRVGKAQRRDRRVNVACLADLGVHQNRAGRVHFFHFAAIR